ncbi:TorF family putative porin [Thalassotalea sp. ND16A]|uniref:TorF family putative porin n=1 Tax=Thalassotalea sp. ND16A TaxID=1535422 RepID=UPI00051A6D5B|nr:TorF family putative porin [Thalassotalea sp. ND16A]KGJ91086.1 hypothetical protein ND16A_0162 [Thalassotalea sp. ND16A]
MNAVNNLLVASIVLSTSFVASAEQTPEKLFNGSFSGSLEIASDYVFRGESEVADGEIPAVKGSFTWTHDSGTYAGLYSATNKFESTPDIYAVVAPYIGKFGSFGDSGFTYNAFVFHYTYPGVKDMDYTELWMKVAKDFDGVKVELEVTPTLNDWFGVDGWSGVNYAVHPSMSFANDVTLSGSVGYQELSGDGAEGWTHWNLGVSKIFYGLTLDLRYHDTDVDSSHKVYGDEQGRKIFDQRFVFAVRKSF